MTKQSCGALEEVRRHIDDLDRRLVQLIAERGAYVRQAAKLKTSAAEVPAPARVEQVIAKVTALARESGAEPAVVEATWRAMVGAFIRSEQEQYASLHPPS